MNSRTYYSGLARRARAFAESLRPQAAHHDHADTKPHRNGANGAAQNGTSTLATERLRYEVERVRKITLDNAEREGRLIDRRDVEKAAADTARLVRDGVLGVPDRIAAQVAAEQDERIVHDTITAELEKALETLAHNISRWTGV